MKKLNLEQTLIKIEKQLNKLEIDPNEDFFNVELNKCMLLIDVIDFIKNSSPKKINKLQYFIEKKFIKKSKNNLPF